MEAYKQEFALTLAETGALFFDDNLVLKDGRPTPYFVNMAMFKTGSLALKLGSFYAGMMMDRGLADQTDIILGPSYKGSSIALATAISLWRDHGYDVLFDYDRKEAKTHGEATARKSLLVNRTLFDGCRIFIVDDVATSMGTKYDLLAKIADEAKQLSISYQLVGIGIGVDREQTTAVYDEKGEVVLGKKGVNAIQDFVSETGVKVFPVAGIRELVEFLYTEAVPVMIRGKRSPIDPKTKQQFDTYLSTYGVE
ncbi:MAG: hypothetical protein JRH08_13015 [Deltaproteobacteria bacterium]|nr:hypothetical protein [Deltaproteobacteria bacterium]MBW1930559.1 hypothetical protein [Deltaproteobacteria bacterium]MBW2026144.1 hypothetical protein [Deltaproteobacteria bacterium]MBW2126583.1 hypothetical protein [Deltaproteobacteria bacterium]RLB23770.1 MAG: hypothetical protein DRG76_03235 [Deltaproteobacteria bacterium]